jgi:hypothetical protein
MAEAGMPGAPGIGCVVPIRVRLVGRPAEADLARLEDAVARLVTSRIDLAARLRSGTGGPAPVRGSAAMPGPERDRYEPGQDRPGQGGYELPSYQRPPDAVRVPVAGGDGGLPPAPTPAVTADNPLTDAMAVFAAIRPSETAAGTYQGVYQGRPFSLDQAGYSRLRTRVREAVIQAIRHASSRAEDASGRYEEQQKVDADHWIVAPIVKALGRVRDPGLAMVLYVQSARLLLIEARGALDRGDFVAAARRAGDGERAAEQAVTMVLAYVDQIISVGEMTVTVLEGVEKASKVVLFLCAVAATGGAAGAGASALGLEGAGATSTVLGFTASTATWATAVGTTAAITEEVAAGIVRAAEGEDVDWGEIVVDAAVQVVVAKFSGGLGQRLTRYLGLAAVANPALRGMIARVGLARVVSVATTVLLHEGSQFFTTSVQETVRLLRGQHVTWRDFEQQLFDRLLDSRGLALAAVAGTLGGTHPEPARPPARGEPAAPGSPRAPRPPRTAGTGAAGTGTTAGQANFRDVNRELGLPRPRRGTSTPAIPPPGARPATAETEFRASPAERAAAYAREAAQQGPVRTAAGTPVLESANASPKGPEFQAASMRARSAFATSIRADAGENLAYQAALKAGEIGLERPQGTNVPGRPDFITAARDPDGELWIIANDAKTRSSDKGSFPEPEPGLRPGWDAHVRAAAERARFDQARLAAEVKAAYRAGRVWVRQVNVDLAPPGQGATSGVAPPAPVPWAALLGPRRLRRERRK